MLCFTRSIFLTGAQGHRINGAESVNFTRYFPFVGRLFIGLPFMASDLSKVANYAGTIALIESSKLPLPPPLACAGAISVEVGCGLLIILGYQTRVEKFKHFVDDEWRAADGNGPFDVYRPYDRKLYARVAAGGRAEVARAVDAAAKSPLLGRNRL
jgi:hypothetical protein